VPVGIGGVDGRALLDGVDALTLARAQFAFTVFPAFSIGLASYLAVLNALHLRTGGGISSALRLLEDDLRGRLWYGRGLGDRHVLPVRHQLVGVLRPPDGCRFVGGVIVHDDVDVEPFDDLNVELLEEVQKLGGPMPLVAFADDKTGSDIECGEQ
jgi:hypothetical protein